MTPRAHALLRLDGGAGFLVGVVVLVFRETFAELYRFPLALVTFLGLANLLYGSYSGTLAVRAWRGTMPSRRAIDVLIAANLAWVPVCVAVVAAMWRDGVPVGLALVALEAVFVGALALAERRWLRPALG